MSTANKLTYLNSTKQAIKQAINEDFEVIDNNTTFREYADEISSNNAKYKDLIPKETTNATNTLDISNSSGLDKALVTQYGNTYQETTTGKNLFDEDTIIPTSIGSRTNATYDSATRTLTLTNNSSDTFLPTLYGNSPYINGINITVKANTTYTLSFNVDQPVSTLKIGVYGVQANNTYILCSGWYQTTSFSFNTNEFTQIAIKIGTTSASGVVTKFSDFQLEESPSTTPFEPYTNGASPNPDYPQTISNVTGTSTITIANSDSSQSQSYTINLGDIELCKIGDYKDRIYSLNGKWYLEKNIGKVVLNGSENWSFTSNGNAWLISKWASSNNAKQPTSYDTISNSLSNYFINISRNALTSANNGFGIAPTGAFNIKHEDYLTSSSDFTGWLSTHNVIAYYQLATPTTTEITESNYPTLYNQLNNIKLFEGVNHLTFTNESGLDVEFDIEYYKDWKLD